METEQGRECRAEVESNEYSLRGSGERLDDGLDLNAFYNNAPRTRRQDP